MANCGSGRLKLLALTIEQYIQVRCLCAPCFACFTIATRSRCSLRSRVHTTDFFQFDNFFCISTQFHCTYTKARSGANPRPPIKKCWMLRTACPNCTMQISSTCSVTGLPASCPKLNSQRSWCVTRISCAHTCPVYFWENARFNHRVRPNFPTQGPESWPLSSTLPDAIAAASRPRRHHRCPHRARAWR